VLTSTCTQLTSRIATAAADPNHGEGDVIVLSGMCEAGNLKMTAGVSIPAGSNFSIEGAPGTTSGFDGTGVTAPIRHRPGFGTVGTMTLRNLVFQHANVTATGGGGALHMLAAHITLEGDSFIENTTHGGAGGAVWIFIPQLGKPPVCQTSAAPAGATI